MLCLTRACNNGQALAALSPAALKRRSSILCAHTCTEAVHLRPLPLLRLICSLGHKSTPSIRNWLKIVKDSPLPWRLDLLV